ncbi:hypothetical protein [Nannocystis pusilla]|uniref:hypothetical protein n=1 Tax=Nannocystis pusilla TaxID=889268 RepID=UPI003B7766DA
MSPGPTTAPRVAWSLIRSSPLPMPSIASSSPCSTVIRICQRDTRADWNGPRSSLENGRSRRSVSGSEPSS